MIGPVLTHDEWDGPLTGWEERFMLHQRKDGTMAKTPETIRVTTRLDSSFEETLRTLEATNRVVALDRALTWGGHGGATSERIVEVAQEFYDFIMGPKPPENMSDDRMPPVQ